jgi:hypothetical protein
MQMSEVGKWESGKPAVKREQSKTCFDSAERKQVRRSQTQEIFRKIIADFLAQFKKNLYLCNTVLDKVKRLKSSGKNDIKQRNLRHSQREKFS